MQNINIRKAAESDIELLIKLRFDYLTDNYGEPFASDVENALIEQLREYYPKHLKTDDFIAALGDIDGKVAGTAFMVITEKPANPQSFSTGKTALILNVLTYPEYRRQGLATKLMEFLINEAKKANVSYIELTATSMGKPVYEKVGFTERSHGNFTEMKLNLI